MVFGRTKTGQYYNKASIPTLRITMQEKSSKLSSERERKKRMLDDLVKGSLTKDNATRMRDEIKFSNHKIAVLGMQKQDAVNEIIRLEKIKDVTTVRAEKTKARPDTRPVVLRKNTSYGKKSWYRDAWQERDRTLAQFGWLLTHDRKWVEEAESDHRRISYNLAFDRIKLLKEKGRQVIHADEPFYPDQVDDLSRSAV